MRLARALMGVAIVLVSSRAAADTPEDPPPVVRAATPRTNAFSLKVALGGDLRELYGVPIYAGDAHLALGGQVGAFAAYATAGLTMGATQYALGTTIIEVGGSIERRFDRVALGLGIRPSYLRVNRVTTNGAFDSLGVGAAPFVTFDVLSSEGHTLFVAASLNLDEYLVGSTSFMWGPTLSIGYREED